MKKRNHAKAAFAAQMMVAALAVSMLAGCGAQTQATEAAVSDASSAQEAEAPAEAPADAGAASTEAQEGEIVYRGIAIGPGKDMAPVLKALGEPDDYSENVSCMFESGMDKTYTYADLVIYTYPTETNECILLVDVTGEDAKTSRGVKVGDALDAALLAYGDDIAAESTERYTATFDNRLLTLVAQEGTISEITVEQTDAPEK